MQPQLGQESSVLFRDMCLSQDIPVKTIKGFRREAEHRPGRDFVLGEDETHEWNAVYVNGCWGLVDCSMTSRLPESAGIRRTNEHYFLTDPNAFIWSHFPVMVDDGSDPSLWQLLEKPMSLEEFNALPKVTPAFFEYNMVIRTKQDHPYVFRIQTEVSIGTHEPMRYKYNLFLAEQEENSSLNHFAFCQLKENRLVGSFTVNPPLAAKYYLKVSY